MEKTLKHYLKSIYKYPNIIRKDSVMPAALDKDFNFKLGSDLFREINKLGSNDQNTVFRILAANNFDVYEFKSYINFKDF